jgi:hypothetical protein
MRKQCEWSCAAFGDGVAGKFCVKRRVILLAENGATRAD